MQQDSAVASSYLANESSKLTYVPTRSDPVLAALSGLGAAQCDCDSWRQRLVCKKMLIDCSSRHTFTTKVSIALLRSPVVRTATPIPVLALASQTAEDR